MINASTITKAVETRLKNGLNSDYTVERSEYLNMNYDLAPWIGIYRGRLVYDPMTLGRGSKSWKAVFEIRLIVQSASLDSGADAEDKLEDYIATVLDLIVADKTFNNTVGMVTGISVDYSYQETESETLYFQNAEIKLQTEVRTS